MILTPFLRIIVFTSWFIRNIEFKYALDVFDEFPESQIFVIPVRIDDCEIPYEKLKDIEYVDLFPDWDTGFNKILQAINTEKIKLRITSPTNVNQIKSNTGSSLVNRELGLAASNTIVNAKEIRSSQKRLPLFRGEKSCFIGRRHYIDKEIKNTSRSPVLLCP